jgi:hypothetical protein
MAAVYWNLFSKPFRSIHFIYQHRAGVRPYTSFYNFAESCVFGKQSSLPIMCQLKILFNFYTLSLPFFQSYGNILSSSFNRILSNALVLSNSFTCVGLQYGLYFYLRRLFLKLFFFNNSFHSIIKTFRICLLLSGFFI